MKLSDLWDQVIKDLVLLPCTFLDHLLWGKPVATCERTQAILLEGSHGEEMKPRAKGQHQLTRCTDEETKAERIKDLLKFTQLGSTGSRVGNPESVSLSILGTAS